MPLPACLHSYAERVGADDNEAGASRHSRRSRQPTPGGSSWRTTSQGFLQIRSSKRRSINRARRRGNGLRSSCWLRGGSSGCSADASILRASILRPKRNFRWIGCQRRVEHFARKAFPDSIGGRNLRRSGFLDKRFVQIRRDGFAAEDRLQDFHLPRLHRRKRMDPSPTLAPH